MRSPTAAQFSIDSKTKDRLDRYKAEHKETIIRKLGLKRRLVTNAHVISYLLDLTQKKRGN